LERQSAATADSRQVGGRRRDGKGSRLSRERSRSVCGRWRGERLEFQAGSRRRRSSTNSGRRSWRGSWGPRERLPSEINRRSGTRRVVRPVRASLASRKAKGLVRVEQGREGSCARSHMFGCCSRARRFRRCRRSPRDARRARWLPSRWDAMMRPGSIPGSKLSATESNWNALSTAQERRIAPQGTVSFRLGAGRSEVSEQRKGRGRGDNARADPEAPAEPRRAEVLPNAHWPRHATV
jgi:hypothetical protein